MLFFRTNGKKDRRLMAKNAHKRGRSMRNGNSPSPYTKYNKSPYKYTFKTKKLDAAIISMTDKKNTSKPAKKKVYLEAAK